MERITGFLTIYAIDKSEVYGEFIDSDWSVEDTDFGRNNVFTGSAGDGALDTFQRLNSAGISHVSYGFSTVTGVYEGSAQLLAPEASSSGISLIKIESSENPVYTEQAQESGETYVRVPITGTDG